MRNAKILIVDDDMDIVLALSTRLRAAGYGVVWARDAIGAGLMARKEMPDLVILDLGLPGGDGFTVLNRLQRTASSTLPVIILTAADPVPNRARAEQEGALAFFQKPADSRELLGAIERGLAGHEVAERQLALM